MNKHLLFAVVGVLALIGLGSCGLAKADEPSTNLVEQVFELSDSKQFYRASPDLAPGSSGSSMFTMVDGKYKVIGITTGGFRGFTFMNYFTPIEEINEYLDVVSKIYDKDD